MVNVRHPRCDCGTSDEYMMHATFRLGESLSITASVNAQTLSLCRYQILVAMAMEMGSALHMAGETPEEADKIIEESLVVMRRVRQEQLDEENSRGENVVPFPSRH